jgi:hypothetical protein
MEEMQEILLEKNGEANGQDVLMFEEQLKSFRSTDNIENRGRALTFSPTIARGQHKIAPAKHFELACNNDSDMRAKITKLSSLFADASQRIFCQHLDSHYIELYERQFSVNCILGFGHHDNILTTTSQIHYSLPQGGDLQRDLPTFGSLHVDIQMIQPATPAYYSSATSSLVFFQADSAFHFNESIAFQHQLRCSSLKALTLMWSFCQ